MIPLILCGCAANFYWQGLSSIEEKNYGTAITLLQKAELQNPDVYKIKRELGYAYFLNNEFEEAIEKLKEAQQMNDTDGKVIFFLGVAYELIGDMENAIYQYRRYTTVAPLSHFRKSIAARITSVTMKKIEKEVRQAVAREESLNVADVPENSLAVTYFHNIAADENLTTLMKGLADLLAIDLSKVKKLEIVERIKLQRLLDELKWSQSDYVDKNSAPRMGKLLGAGRVITGTFIQLDPANVRIDAALTQTGTGTITVVQEITGALNNLLRLEKDLVFQIIDELGLELSWQEKQEIKKMPTESLLAFMAYSKGLELEDRGLFDLAHNEFKEAVRLDPQFDLAKSHLKTINNWFALGWHQPPSVQQMLEEYQQLGEKRIDDIDRMVRLDRASQCAQVGQEIFGDNDTREPYSESTGANRLVGDQSGKVKVKIKLPD